MDMRIIRASIVTTSDLTTHLSSSYCASPRVRFRPSGKVLLIILFLFRSARRARIHYENFNLRRNLPDERFAFPAIVIITVVSTYIARS